MKKWRSLGEGRFRTLEFFVAQIRSQKVNFRAASRCQPYEWMNECIETRHESIHWNNIKYKLAISLRLIVREASTHGPLTIARQWRHHATCPKTVAPPKHRHSGATVASTRLISPCQTTKELAYKTTHATHGHIVTSKTPITVNCTFSYQK